MSAAGVGGIGGIVGIGGIGGIGGELGVVGLLGLLVELVGEFEDLGVVGELVWRPGAVVLVVGRMVTCADVYCAPCIPLRSDDGDVGANTCASLRARHYQLAGFRAEL